MFYEYTRTHFLVFYHFGIRAFLPGKTSTIPQKRIEEKLETVDQEILSIRAELHELPTIKEDISSLARSIERLGLAC